jgi:type IV fimbrial biogenesis protein FimT
LSTRPLSLLNRAAGVTMIELVIGVGILSLVLGLGMPSYRAWVLNTKIRNTAESILNGLQLARSEAVSHNAPVQFTLVGTGWTVGCTNVSATCPAVIHSRATGEGSSAEVTAVAPDGMPIRFNDLGQMIFPVLGAAVFTQINVDINPAVLPASQSRDLRIRIDVGGNAKMCDPNVAVVPNPAPPAPPAVQDPRACS